MGVLEELVDARAARRPVVLATVIETSRSVPRHPGSKMLVYADGELSGSVGGGEMESRVIEEAKAVLSDGSARTLDYSLVDPHRGDPGVCGGVVRLFLEPFMPAHTVYVVGCGHVGRAVVDLAHWIGYRVIAVDDRDEMVTEAALPNADERIAGPIEDAMAAHPIGEDTSVVLVTRNVGIDAEVIPAVLATPAGYLGVMGSERRWKTVADQLKLSAADLKRIHAPIGIDVNAETPEEIAVAIIAQVIETQRAS